MSAVLELQNLRKNFGSMQIIQGVNLQIAEGERHAIIGPNGAGKSTLYNLISGLYTVTGGHIRLRGRDITNHRPFEINRLGLSRSFQVSNIFPKMTVFENVRCGVLWSMGCKYSFWQFIDRNVQVQQRTEEILESIHMTDKRHIPASLLPYADQRALEIGITIAGGADVILLDEPTAGMSHTETARVVALIREISQKKTLVVVEHDMGVVFDLADRISVLVYGEIIASDTPDNIRGNRAVREAYLGADFE